MVAELGTHKFIVIGGDAVNALGIVRSLGEIGIKTNIIGEWEPTRHALLSHSKFVDSVDVVQNNDEILQILMNKYGNEKNKPFLFFTWEGHESFCDLHYNEISRKFYTFNAGPQGALNHLLSKTYQCELAAECGLQVPQYKIVPTGCIEHGIPYPIITKTISSCIPSWKHDMIVCYNETDLQNAYQKIEADSVIIEQYIEGTCEVDLKGISINGGQEILFTHQKTWNKRDDKIGHIMYFEPCQNSSLLNSLSLLMNRANYNGIFDAEFIQDKDGNLFFLEVNWRTGMYNRNHTLEGINLPYLWAKSTLEGHIDTTSIHVNTLQYVAFDEINGFADCLRNPKLLPAWWYQFRHADILYYHSKQDPRPTRIAWMHMLMRKISNTTRKLLLRLRH